MLSQLLKKTTPLYTFASKSYDVAVIGGGPGGKISIQIQVTLQQSRQLNWDSIQFAYRKEEDLEELV